MSLVRSLSQRLVRMNPQVRTALLAECGDRVYPLYEGYWVGDYSEMVRRSIDIGWSFACGERVDDSEVKACSSELEDLVTFYLEEEEIGILAETVTLVLHILQSMGPDPGEASLAAARGLLTTIDAAQSAEVMAHRRAAAGPKEEVAVAEERSWQKAALERVERWDGPVSRDLFVSLGGRPPAWLTYWKQSCDIGRGA